MKPTIADCIQRIKTDKHQLGITLFEPASLTEIADFENIMNIKLPADLVTFYSFANGFESDEDMFRIIPLEDIINDHKEPDSYTVETNDFHFAEYMIYSDLWTININPVHRNNYSIYNKKENVITLTKSFPIFLDTFLTRGVFDGLYQWRENIENGDVRNQWSKIIEANKAIKKTWWKLW